MANSESLPQCPSGYTLLTKLGEGGFGIVYKARGPNGKICALKAVSLSNKSLGTRAEARSTWKKEIDVLVATSQNENIVEYYNSFSSADALWLEMEFCSGGSLQTYYFENGISRPLKRQFMLEIASSINYLHGKEIIHRDLKPDNVLIQHYSNGNPHAKLADFGFAYVIASTNLGGNLETYYMNTQLGTYFYMAPEIYIPKYTMKADIFSMGILFSALIRETTVDGNLVNCAVDANGKVWSSGKYMFKTKNQLELNSNAVVGSCLRDLANSMILLDYHTRPTAKEVHTRLQSAIAAGDFDDSPRSRAACTVPAP